MEIWFYLLLCDKHLNYKDTEEDEGCTSHIVLEHRQVQESVLRRGKEESAALFAGLHTHLNEALGFLTMHLDSFPLRGMIMKPQFNVYPLQNKFCCMLKNSTF